MQMPPELLEGKKSAHWEKTRLSITVENPTGPGMEWREGYVRHPFAIAPAFSYSYRSSFTWTLIHTPSDKSLREGILSLAAAKQLVTQLLEKADHWDSPDPIASWTDEQKREIQGKRGLLSVFWKVVRVLLPKGREGQESGEVFVPLSGMPQEYSQSLPRSSEPPGHRSSSRYQRWLNEEVIKKRGSMQ